MKNIVVYIALVASNLYDRRAEYNIGSLHHSQSSILAVLSNSVLTLST